MYASGKRHPIVIVFHFEKIVLILKWQRVYLIDTENVSHWKGRTGPVIKYLLHSS